MPVMNLKGGSSKTTSAVFLAHALYEAGYQVTLVDADPQASAIEWNEDAPAPFPFPLIPLATPRLHEQLEDHLAPGTEAVVIDTPPLSDRSAIVVSALRLATCAVIPTAPTPIEYKRLTRVRETIEQAAGFRYAAQRTMSPVPAAVLLTRVVPNTNSAAVWRAAIKEDGWWCLDAEVRRREIFSQAYGEVVTSASETSYGEAMIEILEGTSHGR